MHFFANPYGCMVVHILRWFNVNPALQPALPLSILSVLYRRTSFCFSVFIVVEVLSSNGHPEKKISFRADSLKFLCQISHLWEAQPRLFLILQDSA